MKTKLQTIWHQIYKQRLCKSYKFHEDYIVFDTIQAEKKKTQKEKETSFRKELVENVGLYILALNKIITAHEWCKKFNFVGSLITSDRRNFPFSVFWGSYSILKENLNSSS